MDSLDPEIRRVVLDGMRQALPDADTEARVLAGLLARIGGGGPGDPSGTPSDPGPALATGTGLGATLKTIVASAVIGTAVVAGIAVANREPGAPIERAAPAPEPPSEPARTVVSEPAIDPPRIDAPPKTPAIATPTPSSEPASERPRRTPAASVTPHDDLAAETELVAQAEAALAAGDPQRALAWVSAHAERHPSGQLALEAEAIGVAAACVAKHDGARARAEQFLRRHGQTPAAATVRARCDAIAGIDEGR